MQSIYSCFVTFMEKIGKNTQIELDRFTLIKYNFLIHYENVTNKRMCEKEMTD